MKRYWSIAAMLSIVFLGFAGIATFGLEGAGRVRDVRLEQVNRFNHDKQYLESLQILVLMAAEEPESETIRKLQEKTFTLYVYHEIISGLKSISKNEKDVEGYARAARAFGYAGREHQAMELLLDGVNANPKAVELWMMIGDIEMKDGRDAEALSVFKHVLSIDRRDSAAHHNCATILATSKKLSLRNLLAAEKHAKAALLSEPENSDYLSTLAQVLFQLGRTKEAISLMQKAIAISPSNGVLEKRLDSYEKSSRNVSQEPDMSFDQPK